MESTLEPWHHTWIIWDAKQDFNRADYRFAGGETGKNARYSIGLTLRTNKSRELDPIAYRDQITLKNLSPSTDEYVMITHAGNVVIPGPGLLDPLSMKKIINRYNIWSRSWECAKVSNSHAHGKHTSCYRKI